MVGRTPSARRGLGPGRPLRGHDRYACGPAVRTPGSIQAVGTACQQDWALKTLALYEPGPIVSTEVDLPMGTPPRVASGTLGLVRRP